MKKKNEILILKLVLMGMILILVNSCDKNSTATEQVPQLKTTALSNITESAAMSGGEITNNGGSEIKTRGLCWSTSPNPTITSSKTDEGPGSTIFTSYITGLTLNSNYYVRAYALNSIGVGYGNELVFNANNNAYLAPCSPLKNSIFFNSQAETYSVIAGIYYVSYGEYSLAGTGNNSDLRIEFSQAPVSGKYITKGATSFIESTGCVVNGVFGGMISYHYVASAGDTVYVIKNGENKYSMTFCNLHFGSGSTSYTFNSDGNLTSE